VSDRSGRLRILSMPSLRVGRLLGIPVELNPSWFLVFALVVVGLAFGYFPEVFPGRSTWVNVANGVVAGILFFGSIVVHEVSHSVIAKRTGLGVDRVTLFMFGGVAQLTEEPRTPGAEFVMAIAGPSASVILSVTCFALYAALVQFGAPDVAWAPLPYLAQVNALVAAFNLLPGFPMDGGRVVRSLVWWATGDKLKATKVAAVGGQVVGWGLVAAGLTGAVTLGLGFAWLCLLGLFIRSLAARSGRQLLSMVRVSVTPVSAVMATPVPAAPAAVASDTRRMAPGQTEVLPVIEHGRLAGAAGSDGTPVPGGLPPLLDASDSVDVAARATSAGAQVVWVVRGNRLVGELTARDIAAFTSAEH
jgi:Zn-dependent protease